MKFVVYCFRYVFGEPSAVAVGFRAVRGLGPHDLNVKNPRQTKSTLSSSTMSRITQHAVRTFADEAPPRPRLVVHAGAHKTGTTTTQNFLKKHQRWIETTFDMSVPCLPNEKQKGAPTCKWPDFCNFVTARSVTVRQRQQCRLLAQMVLIELQRNRTVLISSEVFGADQSSGSAFWRLHQQVKMVSPYAAETLAVIAHRRTLDWLRSMWAQSHSTLDWTRSGQ